jgi:predicted transcriptional regulator
MTDPSTDDRFDRENAALDPPLDEFPALLRITSVGEQEAREAALDRAQRWENGEEVPHVVNFQNPSDLRAVLTERRIELLRSIMDEPPESLRALADRLGRGQKQINDDVHLLAEYGIVHFEDGSGRARKPRVPYETVRIELELSASSEQPTGNATADA